MGTFLKKNITRFGNVISLVSIAFIAIAVYRLGVDFSFISNWGSFLLAACLCVIIKMLSVVLMGSAWVDWLKLFSGKPVDSFAAMRVYLKSNVGKYLPGNVMHYVERNLFAADLGIGQKQIAVSSLLEILGLVVVALLVACLLAFESLVEILRQIFGGSLTPLFLLAGAGIAAGAAGAFLLRKKIQKILRSCGSKRFFRTVLIATVKYALSLVALGVVMVILYACTERGVSWENGRLILSGYTISWVLGFVTPGASGGIGVRELAIAMLLTPVMGQELTLTLSIVHRLITIVGDFLLYPISFWNKKK